MPAITGVHVVVAGVAVGPADGGVPWDDGGIIAVPLPASEVVECTNINLNRSGGLEVGLIGSSSGTSVEPGGIESAPGRLY